MSSLFCVQSSAALCGPHFRSVVDVTLTAHRGLAPVERMSRPNSTVEMEQSLFFFWGILLRIWRGRNSGIRASGAVPKFQGLAVRRTLPGNT